MSRSFAFHPEARLEFREAVKFYESERRGVGLAFSKAVRSAIDYLLEHPLSGPYTLIYLYDTEVTIIAVAHQRRSPGYWRERLVSP